MSAEPPRGVRRARSHTGAKRSMLQCADNRPFNETLSSRRNVAATAPQCAAIRSDISAGGWDVDIGGRTGVFDMLSKRLCPHTGIVNFYFDAEPHFAVGSVVKMAGDGYLWRCYTDPCEAVRAEADMTLAEQRLADLCRQAAAPRRPETTAHARRKGQIQV